MRALVVHDCVTAGYTRALQAWFPDWEVRGAVLGTARAWLAGREAKPAFLDYLRRCELLVGPVRPEPLLDPLLPAAALRLRIPHFLCRGLHPDCFQLKGCESPLGPGLSLQSQIVFAAFRAGLAAAQVPALFRAEVYAAFGHAGQFAPELAALLGRFRAHGIELAEASAGWLRRGSFLYIASHPRIDVLRAALRPYGLAPAEPAAEPPDDLAESLVWPVYPELAAPLGLEGSLRWRLGREQGCRSLDLAEFVAASYRTLAAGPVAEPAGAASWQAALASVLDRRR